MSVALSTRLRRAFGAEAAIGVVTLALSAWLLAFTPPNVDPSPSDRLRGHPDPRGRGRSHRGGGPLHRQRGRQRRACRSKSKEPAEGLIGLDVVLEGAGQPDAGRLSPGDPDRRTGLRRPRRSSRFPVRPCPATGSSPSRRTPRAARSPATPQIFSVLDADGTAVTNPVVAPTVSIVEVEVTEVPTTDG